MAFAVKLYLRWGENIKLNAVRWLCLQISYDCSRSTGILYPKLKLLTSWN